VGVYGPADHSRSPLFLQELEEVVTRATYRVLVAGDFNLIRGSADKNNRNIDWSRVNLFNDSIARLQLREVVPYGARFTWTNKQLNPVRSVLDRVFISPQWETSFLLLSLVAESSIGSDHTPPSFSTGADLAPRASRFFFENSWLSLPGFTDMIQAKWGSFVPAQGFYFDAIGFWHHQIGLLRRYLKGWDANLHRDSRYEKDTILQQIQELDLVADGVGLNDEGWMLRYHLEETLVNLYQKEENYWRQRSHIKWTVEGDANTAYFHAIANGQRRKCAITSLSTPSGPITDQQDIQSHVYAFYRELMGTEEPQLITLISSLWDVDSQVSNAENVAFSLTFSHQELDEVLAQTKLDTAPGPDGFPVAFFKAFWPMLKPLILRILNDFALGRLDISRLNFGVLSLLPKVPGADSIKLFRPIALINVIFKFISKGFATRLSPIAHRVISPTQTAFIKGSLIHDGALALHEIIDEIKFTGQRAVILKLDFEKAYDRVSWAFLRTVLSRKGFEGGNVHRLMQLVTGAQTAIAINGEIGPFFRNRRGVC
jgi:hypothetical protein